MEKFNETIDRRPAVAGKFYPANVEELQKEIDIFFKNAAPKQLDRVRAIICPHAGYVFSGKITASAFNQIDANREYKRIFLIGSSHYKYFDKASVYCSGNFLMPYGEEKVDMDFGRKLVENFPEWFTDDRTPHLNEHCLEVQLPFLHHVLRKNYVIVPILIGTAHPSVCKQIASVLKPYFNEENLFVVSSDFSHYPAYQDAKYVDSLTKDAICSNRPEKLLETLAENERKHISNLQTSLCGWTSVLTLLYMTSSNKSLKFHAVDYCNSGDVKYYGERDRVVGYWAIAVAESKHAAEDFYLTEKDKKDLLKISRKTLEEHCRAGRVSEVDTATLSETVKKNCGAFVTLHKRGALRGCIGILTAEKPLYKTVQEMTIAAASHDPRFMPVEASELPFIDIEISALSPLKKINDISEIELGKHGILIEKNFHRGVFLPQVATETGWSLEEFLGHCSADKAGLGWDGWKTGDIYIFTATVFSEKDFLEK